MGIRLERTVAFVALAMALFSSMAGAMSREEEGEISRAELLIEERRPAEALALLEPLLEANPELPGVRYQAALAAQMTGDSAKATSLATEAMQRKEETSKLQVLIGVLAMQEKNYSGALAAFERASQLDSSDAVAFYNASEVLRELDRPEEAIQMLQCAQRIEPRRKIFILKERLAQIESGKNLEEIEFEVLKRQGEEEQTEDWLMTAAAVHLRRGNYRQAIEALRAAQGVMGFDKVRAVFSEDHFLRKFADDEQMAAFRQDIGLR